MTTDNDPFADTVSLVVSATAHDPHAALTVRYAVLDSFEAPTRALAVPETVATSVWSPPVSPGAPTELVTKPSTPRPAPRHRQLALAAFIVVIVVVALLVVRRRWNATDVLASPTHEVTDQPSVPPHANSTTVTEPPRQASELSATDRTELERVAVEALLSGDAQRARGHYQHLASRTGDEVFDLVVAVLEQAP